MARPSTDFDATLAQTSGERILVVTIALAVGSLALMCFAEQWNTSEMLWISPVIALCILLLSASLALLRWRVDSPAARRAALATAGLVGVVNLVLVFRNLLSTELVQNNDTGLNTISWRIAGLGLAQLAPSSALLMVLSAGVLASLAAAPKRQARWRPIGLYLSLVLVGVHSACTLSQQIGAPLLPDNGEKIPLLSSALLTGLNSALAIACGARTWIFRFFLGENLVQDEFISLEKKRRRKHVAFAIIVAIAVVTAAGYAYLSLHISQMKHAVALQLTEIADLKVSQIEAWRRERLGDARTLSRAFFVSKRLESLSSGSATQELLAPLESFLAEYRKTYGISAIVLIDRFGKEMLASPSGKDTWDAVPAAFLDDVGIAGDVLTQDLHRGADGGVYMEYCASVRTANGSRAGTIVLRIDARTHLFPIIRKWPAQSASGETELIRREGLSVVFLNDLRFRADSALNLRFPLGQPELPAAYAALEKHMDLTEGVDYRGVHVLSVARPVANSPWVIVSKIDRSEAYESIRTEAWQVASVFILGLIASGLMVGNYWRHRQQIYEQQQLETESERRAAVERLSLVMRHANDVILLFNDKMRIVEANERAEAVYGRTPLEMKQLTVHDLRAVRGDDTIARDFSEALSARGIIFETVHRSKDGTEIPVEISARPVEIEGQSYVLSIVRDITQRKTHEFEIERLSRMYFVISQVSQTLVRAKSKEKLFPEICSVLVEVGHFKIAWVGWLNQETKFVEPVAIAGDEYEYVTQLHVSTDPELSEGRGPSGTAFREGRVHICNDFFSDPTTLPWRERAARSGFRSSLALPLKCEGIIVALLAVYAEEKNFFAPREIELLEETAGDVSFALDVYASEARRREAEEALKGRMEIFSNIVGQALDAVALVDASTGRFLEFNRAAHEGLGYTQEEFAAFRIIDIQAELTEDQIRLKLEALKEQRGITFETRHRHHDGRLRDVRVSARLINLQGRDCITAMWGDITEAKQAEAERRKLSSVVEQSPASIVITDLTGMIEYVNPHFTEVTGYTLDEVRGKNPRVLKSGLTDVSVYEDLWNTITSGEVWRGEIINRKKNGQSHVELVVITPVIDSQGIPTHFVAIKEDITIRKQAEEKLRQLSRTIEQAPLSIAITDLLGDIEYVNPAFLAITGYTREEVIGQNPRILQSGITAPETYLDMWKSLTRGQIWRGELHNKKKNGELYVENAVIAPVTNEGGTITHYVALKEDITARKQTEAALRETQDRYRLIAENTDDVIWLYDLVERRFTYCSPSVYKLRGYTAEEVLSQRMTDVLTPESADLVTRELQARLFKFAAGDPSAQTQVYQVEQQCRDGSVVSTEVVTTLLADPDGQAAQVLGVCRDTTERKRAVEVLRQSFNRLAKAEHIARLGNWVLELPSRQFSWSEEMFHLLELNPATTIPSVDLWESFMPPEDKNDLVRLFAESLVNGRRFSMGTRLILPSGRTKHIEGTCEPIFSADGKPIRAIGTVQDVTERKLVEIELHELVKGLRALHQISQALERRDLKLDELLATLLHCIPSAMSFPENARVIVELDQEERSAGASGPMLNQLSVPIKINDRIAGCVTVGYVRPHPNLPDAPFHVRERELLENIARTIGLGLGEREAFATVQRFNVELEGKIAQRTSDLAARNREVQALLESIPDMVLRLRRNGTMIDCQHAKGATPLAGLSLDPSFGQQSAPTEILRTEVLATGSRALTENTTTSSEAELPLNTGSLSVEVRATPIGTDEFVVFVRDITARKRLQAETAAMLEKERQVSEMKTRFISVTSHEFRTPMAAAMGSADLLCNHLDRLAPPKRTELLGRITSSLHRMTEMLDDLLLLNRMDSNRTEVLLVSINLHQFIQNAIEEIRLGDRDAHSFELQAAGDATQFVTDTNLLHHIISNLLSNAVRYSPAGTTVSTRIEAEAWNVQVTVVDRGIGIPEADRSRIFEPFERGSNVGNIKGTGLGLNIVKRMTELLNGTIAVDAVDGGGTRFTLTFPRSKIIPHSS